MRDCQCIFQHAQNTLFPLYIQSNKALHDWNHLNIKYHAIATKHASCTKLCPFVYFLDPLFDFATYPSLRKAFYSQKLT